VDAKALFLKALEQGTNCVRHVRPSQFTNSTPCTELSLKDLLNHMINELSWVAPLVEGKTIAEVGDRFDGDLVGDDAQAAWNKAAKKAREAVEHADMDATAHLSYGDRPVREYINEVGSDILVHTWDVAQGIQCTLQLDEAAVQTVYDNSLPHKENFTTNKPLAGPIDVPGSSDIQTKLLALYGRRVPAI